MKSDLTDFLGLPWDFVRENAMIDHFGTLKTDSNPQGEEYIKNYWTVFNNTLKAKELDAELEEMKNFQA